MDVDFTLRRSIGTQRGPAAAVVGLSALAAAPLHAAEWKHEVAPYLWGAAMSGTTAIDSVGPDVDASFSDILGSLELGFMGTYRATRDRVSITIGRRSRSTSATRFSLDSPSSAACAATIYRSTSGPQARSAAGQTARMKTGSTR